MAVGAAGAFAPFVLKVERISVSGSSVTYRDWAAVAGGATAILFALIAIPFVRRAKVPPLFAAVAILAGIGGYQVARGFGAFAKLAVEERHELAIDLPPPPPPPKAETPADKAGAQAKACNAGDKEACFSAMAAYTDLKDFATAYAMDHKGCELGNAASCREEANDFFNGTGVAKDETKYLPLKMKACDLADIGACAALAEAYFDGKDTVEKDTAKAVELGKRACVAGTTDKGLFGLLASACVDTGLALVTGDGVPKDEKTALALFEFACNADKKKCKNYGTAFERGLAGTKKDHARAIELWTTGCDAGGLSSCEALLETVKDPAKRKALEARIAELKQG